MRDGRFLDVFDRELGERDRAEMLDAPARRLKRPRRQHSAMCVDAEGQFDCVCGPSWADHPAWKERTR